MASFWSEGFKKLGTARWQRRQLRRQLSGGKAVASKGLAARNKVIRTAFGRSGSLTGQSRKFAGLATPEIPISYVILLWRHPAVM
jgi:hypothetical protein